MELKTKNSVKRYVKIIVLGLVVHLILVLAAFDLYFASPLDHGMTPIKSTTEPPAKRVVLFVADGLRARAVYGDNNEVRIPFLTGILKNNGSWGVSHTRVPTESRPGHVAMLGGIYEDPSAVFKGWKHNPVNFDSVINQSTNAWCWGSPDIVNLFNKDHLHHIRINSYDAEMEDFGKNNTKALDEWVFKRVEEQFINLNTCSNCHDFFADGNIYFLHLLGIDTAGHGYKPHSSEYINNIKMVDLNIETIYGLFENTFKDQSTAYIFTSDHGMTNWGSHGAGSDDETKTPIIAWGSGIKIDKTPQDIQQIDIAPLIASLIGINIPSNSLGKVPYKFIDTSTKNIAKLLISNVLQLLEIFNVKRLRVQENSISYFPFKNISSEYIKTVLTRFNSLHESEKFGDLVASCDKLIDEIIMGIDYYHYYYQKAILISVSVGFLIWMIILLTTVLTDNNKSRNKKIINLVISIFAYCTIFLCYIQKFSVTYYIHFLFPIVVLYIAVQDYYAIRYLVINVINYGLFKTIIDILFYLIGLELLVLGFTHRWFYSIVMIVTAFWVIFSEALRKNSSLTDKCLWIGCSLVLSIFPSLPVMKTTFNIPFYIFGFMCWILYFIESVGRLKIFKHSRSLTSVYSLYSIQISCLVASVVYMLAIEFEYIMNDSIIKYVSIVLSLIPVIIIPYFPKIIQTRLISIHLGFTPYFMLVSSNYECIFLACFTVMLNIWLHVECEILQKEGTSIYITAFTQVKDIDNKFKADTLRRGFLFMIFIFVGFFGTGNIASINSFDPMWVRAFLTVFSPFKMTTLILIKVIIPFIFVCCVFRAINTVFRENMLSMFCIILFFADVMVLQCLFLITNKGSWLDIGTSLSHFLIMELFVIIIILLYSFSQILTSTSYVENPNFSSYKLL